MTLTQINELTIEDCTPTLLYRLEVESATQEELEAEFELYKGELIAEEEARIAEIARKQDLEDRFAALSDRGVIQGASGIQNPAAYFKKEIIAESNHESAEQKMAALENAYSAYVQEHIVPANQQAKRAERDAALTATDWTMLADSPLSSEVKLNYRNYRQYLRDLPQKSSGDFQVMAFSEWKAFNKL